MSSICTFSLLTCYLFQEFKKLHIWFKEKKLFRYTSVGASTIWHKINKYETVIKVYFSAIYLTWVYNSIINESNLEMFLFLLYSRNLLHSKSLNFLKLLVLEK